MWSVAGDQERYDKGKVKGLALYGDLIQVTERKNLRKKLFDGVMAHQLEQQNCFAKMVREEREMLKIEKEFLLSEDGRKLGNWSNRVELMTQNLAALNERQTNVFQKLYLELLDSEREIQVKFPEIELHKKIPKKKDDDWDDEPVQSQVTLASSTENDGEDDIVSPLYVERGHSVLEVIEKDIENSSQKKYNQQEEKDEKWNKKEQTSDEESVMWVETKDQLESLNEEKNGMIDMSPSLEEMMSDVVIRERESELLGTSIGKMSIHSKSLVKEFMKVWCPPLSQNLKEPMVEKNKSDVVDDSTDSISDEERVTYLFDEENLLEFPIIREGGKLDLSFMSLERITDAVPYVLLMPMDELVGVRSYLVRAIKGTITLINKSDKTLSITTSWKASFGNRDWEKKDFELEPWKKAQSIREMFVDLDFTQMGMAIISGSMLEGIPKTPVDMIYFCIQVHENEVKYMSHIQVVWSLSREVLFYDQNKVLMNADVIRPLCAETYNMQTVEQRWEGTSMVRKYLEDEYKVRLGVEDFTIIREVQELSQNLMLLRNLNPSLTSFPRKREEVTSWITSGYMRYVKQVRVPFSLNDLIKISVSLEKKIFEVGESGKDTDDVRVSLVTFIRVLESFVREHGKIGQLYCPGFNYACANYWKYRRPHIEGKKKTKKNDKDSNSSLRNDDET